MKILVINAGSSSLKYQVINTATNEVLTKGLCERIGIDGWHTNKTNGKKFFEEVEMKNHSDALKVVLNCIESETVPTINSLKEIEAVGHRVLHGGEYFADSALIDEEVMKKIEDLVPLGPLHQPGNIAGIRACQEILKGVPQVAVFDTTFHATMPDYAYRYAIPKNAYTDWKIRKYGFHGTSHKFIAGELEKLEGKKGNFIICHIGNGASLSAVKDGKCIDTTMGYTPLEGVVMGTRSGDIDPTACERIMKETGMNITEMIQYLNKKSGILGVSGISGDMRDVEEVAYSDKDDPRKEDAILALKMHAYRVKKYIGAFYAALGTVDAIAFTAGVGENGPEYRQMVLDGLEGLGIIVDKNKNMNFKRGETCVISADNSKVKVYVIPTDEEFMIAKDTERLSK
ncbi:MAG: acetate kinase [Clostridia bacterium]|nr:acetate kinase [Clostridia bacterium]